MNVTPVRGQILFVSLPQDPPGKGARPVIVVSLDARNLHPRASTVLVVPLSTSIHKNANFHLLLSAGETGLSEDSIAQAENITVVAKAALMQPRSPLRAVSSGRICELADRVRLAMAC